MNTVGCFRIITRRSYCSKLKELIPAEVKWKQRWDEVQSKIKDQQDIAFEFGVNQPSINWFPGHMYKASKQMEDILTSTDISLVLEIRDARVSLSID